MSFITRASLETGRSGQNSLVALLLDASRGDASHRLVWSLFSERDAKRDFLYREMKPGHFLIVSARAPVDSAGLWRLESKPYAPYFSVGQRLGFSLRANPSMRSRASRELSGRGRRIDAVMHAKIAARTSGQEFGRTEQAAAAVVWLTARADRLGVKLDPERCSATTYTGRSIGRKVGADAEFHTVDYEGTLEVVHPDTLSSALTQGIGAAKAYGCGLLLVRPDHAARDKMVEDNDDIDP